MRAAAYHHHLCVPKDYFWMFIYWRTLRRFIIIIVLVVIRGKSLILQVMLAHHKWKGLVLNMTRMPLTTHLLLHSAVMIFIIIIIHSV